MTMPPTNSAIPIPGMLSRFLPITFLSKNEGTAVQTKAIKIRVAGWVRTVRSPRKPLGKVEMRLACS